MKKTKEITKKKVYLAIITATLAFGMLTGCGKKEAAATASQEPATEAVNEAATEAAEANENEEEVAPEENEDEGVATPFLEDLEIYDSIISTITPEQYYAFAAVGDGYDVLLVADGVYDNLDGNMAAIDATVYGLVDGEPCYAGSVWSDGTAYPLAVYEDCIMFGGNHHMAMASVKDGSVIIKKEADEVFDEQGNATYSYNEGDIDNIKEVEDDSILKEMYETYNKATVINFFQGEAEFVPDPEIGDYPSNGFEDRVGKTSFESYDEIIGLLEGDEAYALVNVKGYDGEVLLVTDYTYDDLMGHIATTECTPYTIKADGTCSADSIIVSGGTATPIKMDKDGVLMTASHTSVEKDCYGENGTPNSAIMVLATATADELDDNGNPKTVYGFTRTKNSVIDDDSKFFEGNEIDIYNQLFDEYNKAEEISFTRVK